MKKPLTMTEIIERLTEWKQDTDIDVRNTTLDNIEMNNSIRQSTQLAMAIGLLQTLGKNNNIHES